MRVDFFEDTELVEEPEFGICDDPDVAERTPAYVSRDVNLAESWGAKVSNRSGSGVYFIAVDNKIDIRRDNGDMENRCDAMLRNDRYLVFVELKDQRQKWIQHAVWDQLFTTINVFKENHNIGIYPHREAYVCNKKHPRYEVGSQGLMNTFRQKTSVRLVLARDITIK